MPTFDINGVAVYYEVHGEGEPLVLIHHGIGCTRMWEQLLPGLTRRFRIIAYDRRGFGRSEGGQDFPSYYLGEEYTEHSVGELSSLLQQLNIKGGMHLVGQCEGGVIALNYAAQYPERVRTVTASSTLCYSGTTVTELCKDRIFPSFEAAELDFRKKMGEWHGEAYAPELYSLFVQMGGAYGSGVFDIRQVLKAVRCPALVLYPDRSALFDVEQGVLMYRALPNGELAVLPACSHNTYEQQPAEYLSHLLSFLERHS